MNKLSFVMQALIIVLLAIVIALIIYYGTNPPKAIKAPAFQQPVKTLASAGSLPFALAN